MKHRSPIAVLLLPFVTFGIYAIYWEVVTKIEMNKRGANIPTAWLIIVPIVNIWWLWKYSEGVEQVTGNKMSGVMSFILLFLLGFIGAAIVQDSFNKVGEGAPVADAPVAPPAAPVLAEQPTSTPTQTPPTTPTTPTV